jgi:branched-chain amino acid transport system ATP-binding protein
MALLGPNGAGKTSLLSAIAGVVPAAAGTVTLDGADITGRSAHRLAAAGLRMVPETRALFPDMTVADNLAVGAPGGRLDDAALDRIVEVFPVLGDRLRQQAGTLSGGEQQQLAIARALIGEPRVLLLDEPSMGLAPRIVASIMATLAELTAGGLAVLLAEQNANAVLGTVDRALVMDRGRIVTEGTPDVVRQTLSQGYLGGRS